MGQGNAKRIHPEFRETITSSKVDDRQNVDKTCYFKIGDTVDHIIEDANGNITIIDDNLTVQAIAKNQSVLLDQDIDTTTPGTHRLRNQEIDDLQAALDRLYCDPPPANILVEETENILAFELNASVGGRTLFDVEDVSLWRVGDLADVISDEGLQASDVVVTAVTVNADDSNNYATIEVNSLVDLTGLTNPFIQNKSLSVEAVGQRNQERIDEIDRPIENEAMEVVNGATEGTHTAFETSSLFRAGTTKLLLDGSRLRLGTAGTRAGLTQGAGDAQLIFTSMLLGVLGNEVEIEVVNAPGLTVAVTKAYNASSSAILPRTTQYLVQVNNNSGAATAQEIADAINADSEAKRIVQAVWGGNGTGVVAAFGPTNLTGGLDDGTGDYAELEQVFENGNVATGYKWVSLHMRPDERNRLNQPPEDDEELTIDYRQAMSNVNR